MENKLITLGIKLTYWLLIIGFVAFYWSDVGEIAYFSNYYEIRLNAYNSCLTYSSFCNFNLSSQLPTTNITLLEEIIKQDARDKYTWYDTQRLIFGFIFIIILGVYLSIIGYLIRIKKFKVFIKRLFSIDFKAIKKHIKHIIKISKEEYKKNRREILEDDSNR